MQREQGRDLFDLFHAWQLSEANALLDARLRKAAFRRDMDTLLRPGLPRFDVDNGALVVREAYFTHLKP